MITSFFVIRKYVTLFAHPSIRAERKINRQERKSNTRPLLSHGEDGREKVTGVEKTSCSEAESQRVGCANEEIESLCGDNLWPGCDESFFFERLQRSPGDKTARMEAWRSEAAMEVEGKALN